MGSCKTDFLYTLPESVQELWRIGRFSKLNTVDPQQLKPFREIKKGSSYQKFEANKQNRRGNVSIVHFHNGH